MLSEPSARPPALEGWGEKRVRDGVLYWRHTVGPTGIYACGAEPITKAPTDVQTNRACLCGGVRPRNPPSFSWGERPNSAYAPAAT